MAEKELDILGEAFGETESEVFDDALGDAELDPRALEEMEDLSIKPEAEEAEGEDDEADPEPEAEPEGDEQKRDDEGRSKAEERPQDRQQPQREGREPRIPPARLREANEAKRTAEAERDAAKAQLGELSTKLDMALRQINDLGQRVAQPQARQEPAEPKAAPNLFEDPEGFVNHLQQGFKTELSQRDQALNELRLSQSLGLAHARHGADFVEADKAVAALAPQTNPDHAGVIRRIMGSRDPGEAMVQWFREQRTLREIGNDPAAYQKRIRDEIANDPKFREELLASLREEARNANNGRGNTVTRMPRSLSSVPGGREAQQADPSLYDNSESAVMDFALK